jgi:predicted kinase
MKTLTMFKGLPGSGKDTIAKGMMKVNPGMYKRVNKDDLRNLLDNGHWTGHNEKFTLKIRDLIIVEALKDGKHVLCTDTNFDPKHETRLKQLAKENDAQFVIKDLTDVSIEECIERDLKRFNSVGEKVIRSMYNRYLRKKEEIVYSYNSDLPDCILVDLDGTLALFGNKNPYDRDFENDELNTKVRDIIRSYINYRIEKMPSKNFHYIIISGRSEKFRKVTDFWLNKYHLCPTFLLMRKEGDNRKDVIVKEEMFNAYIRGKLNPLFVIDDRNSVVSFWRSLGLTVFQVNDGDF